MRRMHDIVIAPNGTVQTLGNLSIYSINDETLQLSLENGTYGKIELTYDQWHGKDDGIYIWFKEYTLAPAIIYGTWKYDNGMTENLIGMVYTASNPGEGYWFYESTITNGEIEFNNFSGYEESGSSLFFNPSIFDEYIDEGGSLTLEVIATMMPGMTTYH